MSKPIGTDDLVKRLRDRDHVGTATTERNFLKSVADRIEQLAATNEELGVNINIKADFIDATINQLAASDQRIEELEAKISKCVGALGDISNGEPEWPDDPQRELDWCRNRATTTLAELKGQDDE